MLRLEDIVKGSYVLGVLTNQQVEIIDATWHGTDVLEIVYKSSQGRIDNEILYRDSEKDLTIAVGGAPWSFTASPELFRLAAEAYRIHLAYLFDPMLAVHTSMVEPLPHQITAVYDAMLPRLPLRYVLADDPGAGKTIMAGLLIKELAIRGDAKRVLIVCPGVLAEQWQDELDQKFGLPFEILTNDKLNASRTGNWFSEENMVIARLDKLSRDGDLQEKLQATDWDIIIVDEAHKMSASYFAGEVKYTKRYKLGQLLSRITRHFLLLTATPHNGKEEDFQLWLQLVDGDRFAGKLRGGESAHSTDVSDIMRRLLKEQLLKFDGKPLFPERIAETVPYTLSHREEVLYAQVTNYVREQFNRADRLEGGRKGTVGFALTILQRRLASSPAAIYESIRRRREKLQSRLTEELLSQRAQLVPFRFRDSDDGMDELDEDLQDYNAEEQEEAENEIVDKATTAETIPELRAEIEILQGLERLAAEVKHSGTDKKWEELSSLLQNQRYMAAPGGGRRKLVIFTEHRDTLNYLTERIRRLLGKTDAVVTIQGGMVREERRKVQEAFTQDIAVSVLIATDAAGEGINLQRAHLMVNYDLPWNPNRLEQRFGRIHRIGQTEVCRLWNIIAVHTREGEVWAKLFQKLENERESLGGQVFDVLGEMSFENRSLRDLLIEAIRYGEDPEVRARLDRVVEGALDKGHLEGLLKERALHHQLFSATDVQAIREDMERAEARKLQPHFIGAFFLDAFKRLGGSVVEKEKGRYQILHVPAAIRNRDRFIGHRQIVSKVYERITFQKELRAPRKPNEPPATFICPGHPLLDATMDLVLEANVSLLKEGAILIDEAHANSEARLLFFLENKVQDGRPAPDGTRRIISREVHFLELNDAGSISQAGYAPYLDYRPANEAEAKIIQNEKANLAWLNGNFEQKIISYAVSTPAREHLERLKRERQHLTDKTRKAVTERLTTEIKYWDHRARTLALQEESGKPNARLNSNEARRRANELEDRLAKRLAELEEEKSITARPPVLMGGALVIPATILAAWTGGDGIPEDTIAQKEGFVNAADKAVVEKAAMHAVMHFERERGWEPKDVGAQKCGYDIESRHPSTGNLRFIEVKGRHADATTVTITKNEILCGLNAPLQWELALCFVDGDGRSVHYIEPGFSNPLNFGASSESFDVAKLLTRETRHYTLKIGKAVSA